MTCILHILISDGRWYYFNKLNIITINSLIYTIHMRMQLFLYYYQVINCRWFIIFIRVVHSSKTGEMLIKKWNKKNVLVWLLFERLI